MRAIGLNDLMPMVTYYCEKHHDGDQPHDRDYTIPIGIIHENTNMRNICVLYM